MKHERKHVRIADLQPGYTGETIDFTWRPFAERDAAEQDRMRALRNDIRWHGIRNPLVTHKGRVLIGMRRWEIARDIGITHVDTIDLQEHIDRWMALDVDRLKAWLATVTDTTVPGY